MSRNTRGNGEVGIYDNTPNLIIEGAKLIRRNFRGIDYGYNPNHNREFSILLDPEEFDVDALKDDGWNVKEMRKREGYEDEPTMYSLTVHARFDNFPPVIWLVTQSGENSEGKPVYKRTRLDEESCACIDTAEIANVNVEISHGKTYTMNGKTGIKAYLKKMQIELVQDRFDELYEWDEEDLPY